VQNFAYLLKKGFKKWSLEGVRRIIGFLKGTCTYVRTYLCMHVSFLQDLQCFPGNCVERITHMYVMDIARRIKVCIHFNGFIGRARNGKSQQQVGCSRLHRLAETGTYDVMIITLSYSVSM
jgi:hypothetical protein